jgi:transcriptional regulator with XRE-family HTH domain
VEERNFLHILGERLTQERARLGLTQAELAAATGITRRTQINYESGQRAPDAAYLQTVDKKGIDALFVVTGRRQNSTAQNANNSAQNVREHRASEPNAHYNISGLLPGNVRAATIAVFNHMQMGEHNLDADRAAEAVIVLAEMSKTPEEVMRNALHVLKLMS